MAVELNNVTVDCADPYRLAVFWSAVTGWAEDPANVNEPGDPEGLLISPDGRFRLLFVAVPEAKSGKNRMHLDLRPTDGTRGEEVERLVGLGAVLIEDLRRDDGGGWVVLADPEGNEFCVVRGAAEL